MLNCPAGDALIDLRSLQESFRRSGIDAQSEAKRKRKESHKEDAKNIARVGKEDAKAAAQNRGMAMLRAEEKKKVDGGFYSRGIVVNQGFPTLYDSRNSWTR